MWKYQPHNPFVLILFAINFANDMEMPKAKKWRRNLNLNIMYQLNFPNGNVQTYASLRELEKAARLLGGEAEWISGQVYAFVPKK
jgi:hypothetical protein